MFSTFRDSKWVEEKQLLIRTNQDLSMEKVRGTNTLSSGPRGSRSPRLTAGVHPRPVLEGPCPVLSLSSGSGATELVWQTGEAPASPSMLGFQASSADALDSRPLPNPHPTTPHLPGGQDPGKLKVQFINWRPWCWQSQACPSSQVMELVGNQLKW